MPSILFICTGNLFRSPLAAAFFKQRLGQVDAHTDWRIDSAGTWTTTGQSVPAAMLHASEKLGASLEGHLTKVVDGDLLAGFDLILVMEAGHKEALNVEFPFAAEKTFLLSEVVDQIKYDVPDPAISGQEAERVASDMFNLIERGFERISRLAISLSSAHP